MAAPVGMIAGSALWHNTPVDDVHTLFEQSPDSALEQLLLACKVATSGASMEISDLKVTSVRPLSQAEEKQRLLVYPAIEVAPRLKLAVRLALEGSPPNEALAAADAHGSVNASATSDPEARA